MFTLGVTDSVNVGLAVGLSVGLLFLFLGIGIPVLLVVMAYCLNSKKKHPVVQSHIRTIPITVTTSGTSHQEVSMMSPAGQSQYDLLPMHNRTQSISDNLPPLYNVAAAYTSYMTPSVAQV